MKKLIVSFICIVLTTNLHAQAPFSSTVIKKFDKINRFSKSPDPTITGTEYIRIYNSLTEQQRKKASFDSLERLDLFLESTVGVDLLEE